MAWLKFSDNANPTPEEIENRAKQLLINKQIGMSWDMVSPEQQEKLKQQAKEDLMGRHQQETSPEANRDIRKPSVYDSEYIDMMALYRVLLRNGVSIDLLKQATEGKFDTIADIVDKNKKLMDLASQHGIPREWLLKTIQLKKYRKQ